MAAYLAWNWPKWKCYRCPVANLPFCDYDASNSHSICIYFACGMNNRASSRGPPYIATPVCLCVAYTVHEFSRLTLNIRQVKGGWGGKERGGSFASCNWHASWERVVDVDLICSCCLRYGAHMIITELMHLIWLIIVQQLLCLAIVVCANVCICVVVCVLIQIN